VLAKLGRISAPELRPALGVVTEPFPQLVARREILRPKRAPPPPFSGRAAKAGPRERAFRPPARALRRPA
jgi:hypothetical protein